MFLLRARLSVVAPNVVVDEPFLCLARYGVLIPYEPTAGSNSPGEIISLMTRVRSKKYREIKQMRFII